MNSFPDPQTVSQNPATFRVHVVRQSLTAEKLRNQCYHEWDQHPLLPAQGAPERRCEFPLSCACGLGTVASMCNSSHTTRSK